MDFFFQAEDGIRDLYVTGVQTCALPISESLAAVRGEDHSKPAPSTTVALLAVSGAGVVLSRDPAFAELFSIPPNRSEERRVGKEGIGRGGRGHHNERKKRTAGARQRRKF